MDFIFKKKFLFTLICFFIIFAIVCNSAYAEVTLLFIATTVAAATLLVAAGKWAYSTYQNISGRVETASAMHGQKDIIQDRQINATAEQREVLNDISQRNQESWANINTQSDKEMRESNLEFAIEVGKAAISPVLPSDPAAELIVSGMEAANTLMDNYGPKYRENNVDREIQKTIDLKEKWGTRYVDDAASEEAYWEERCREEEKDKKAREARRGKSGVRIKSVTSCGRAAGL